MALESGTYIDDLNQNNPTGSDGKSQGDDHIRLIKKVILNTFPNIDNPMTATEDELNKLDGCTKTTEDLNTGIIPGLIQMYGGSSEPSGWLFCSGQAVSRSTYSDLFSAIGTSFGVGDGSTTFNVPDLRDRSPLGENTMGASDAGRVGTDTTALGDSGGSDTHTLTESEMPSHDHGGGSNTGNSSPNVDVNVSNLSPSGGSTSVQGSSQTANDSVNNAAQSDAHSHSFSIPSDGGGSAHANMHPFLVVNFIIKT